MGKSWEISLPLKVIHWKPQTLNRLIARWTIRYFILTAHYRSTLDFSQHALQAATKKGYRKSSRELRMLKSYNSTSRCSSRCRSKWSNPAELAAPIGAMEGWFQYPRKAIRFTLFNLLKKNQNSLILTANAGTLGKVVLLIRWFRLLSPSVEDILDWHRREVRFPEGHRSICF